MVAKCQIPEQLKARKVGHLMQRQAYADDLDASQHLRRVMTC